MRTVLRTGSARPHQRVIVLIVTTALLLTGCGTVSGKGTAAVVTPAQAVPASQLEIKGDGGTQFDQLVRNALTDIDAFWKRAFPSVSSGQSFRPLRGGVYSVETGRPDSAEECMRREPKAANNNAFYCPLDDAFAYDRTGLVKSVTDALGPEFAALVMAHETGHLIQNRLDVVKPSIFKETQADCASGAFMAAEAGAGKVSIPNRHFAIEPKKLDIIAVGMILLRDSRPQDSTADGAHGNGFDRLSAFSDGFDKGVTYCYGSAWDTRKYTERPYVTQEDYDQGGNQSLQETLDPNNNLIADLNRFWTAAFKGINKQFKPVQVKAADSPPCAGDSGSKFTYCPKDNTVYYDEDAAAAAYNSVPALVVTPSNGVTIRQSAPGDFALGTMLAYTFGFAVRSQFGLSIDGEKALLSASCYVGAYAKDINVTEERKFVLSPPDMDEATITVLRTAGRSDYFGDRNTTGFERVNYFNKGYFGSLTAC
ncbi:MAG: neutral zinc metallopeptidase [bacterium]